MAFGRKNNGSFGGGGYVKGKTAGTSNEISFSVLDAKSTHSIASPVASPKKTAKHRLGSGVPLFTMKAKRSKSVAGTPLNNNDGIVLSSGEYVPTAVDSGATLPGVVAIESSDMLGKRSATDPKNVLQEALSVSTKAVATASAKAIGAVSGIASAAGDQAASAGASIAGASDGADSGMGAGSGPNGSGLGGFGGQHAADGGAGRQPRGRKPFIIAGAIALAIVLVLLLMFMGGSGGSGEGSSSATGGTDAGSGGKDALRASQVVRLKKALNDLVQADEVLVEMDEVLCEPIDAESFEKIHDVEERLDGAKEQLTTVRKIFVEVSEALDDSADKDAADRAVRTVDARLKMLDAGGQLLTASKSSAQVIELITGAWSQIYEAVEQSRRADSMVSKQGFALNEAEELIGNAYRDALAAHEKLCAAAELFPQADLGNQTAYSGKLLEALRHASACNAAIDVSDTDRALAESDAYNAASKEAAELAKRLPADPTETIRSVYQADVKDMVVAYREARGIAASNDANLRSSLSQ